MKRLALLLAMGAVLASVGTSAFAQGMVTVNNDPAKQRVYMPTGSATSSVNAADSFNVAIFYLQNIGPAPTAAAGAWAVLNTNPLLAGATADYTAGAATFKTGTGATAGLILPKVTGQSKRTLTIEGAAWVQVRAWSSAFATWNDAITQGTGSTFVGVSQIINVPLATGTTPVPQLSKILTTGFVVEPVPEPSTIALGALGLLGLALIRRRK